MEPCLPARRLTRPFAPNSLQDGRLDINRVQSPGSAPAYPVTKPSRKHLKAAANQKRIASLPEATGGPDYFGYTWNNGASISWKDATGGTAVALSGSGDYQGYGPVNLPFSFKFYDEVYNGLYIGASGFVTFDDYWDYPYQQNPFPSSETPNNVIAAFWSPVYLSSSGTNGRIFYKSGGSSPNRYFAIEWHNVRCGPPGDICGGDDVYQYEIVLWENGNIDLQYKDMTYVDTWVYWASIGIEDHLGNGLHYMDWNDYWSMRPTDNKAIRFTRPAPQAFLRTYPLTQGAFAVAGQSTDLPVTIRNTGELGTDTFDLSGTSVWPTIWTAPDGVSPLTDTDGDGLIDSGPVAQGTSKTLHARVQTPVIAHPGDHNDTTYTFHSSINTSLTRNVQLQASVPLPFAQVYTRSLDSGPSLDAVQPAGEMLFTRSEFGYSTGVVEIQQEKWLSFWNVGRCLDTPSCNMYVNEIYYDIVLHSGSVERATTRLEDLSGATVNTSDYSPSVTTTPDGHTGIVWYRYLYNINNNQWNYNIYFAILDSAGNLSYGPSNITNNNLWGSSSSDIGVPYYYNPRIAATEDNRFTITWERDQRASSSGYLYDVYYTVFNSAGSSVKAVTQLTNDVADYDGYYEPVPTALSGNRILLVYYAINELVHVALDSAGNVLTNEYSITDYGWGVDGVQLPTGQICLTWVDQADRIAYAMLDGSSYNIINGPNYLTHPAAIYGSGYPSVTTDPSGRAILTWADASGYSEQNLYYAVVAPDGSIQTSPMVFRNAGGQDEWIESSYNGHGNTPFSLEDTHSEIDLHVESRENSLASAGLSLNLPVTFGNTGILAASPVITATLDVHLTYLSDTSGVTPVIAGNTVRWDFSPTQLGFLGQGGFSLRVRVMPPPGVVGVEYPVTFSIGPAAGDVHPVDNIFVSEILVGRSVNLPLIKH